MNINNMRGLIIASPTPFDSKGGIDREATERMHNYFIENEADGIFLLSSTGEYFSMHPQKRKEFVKVSVDCVSGRVPLMLMVSDASLEVVMENIKCYSESGVNAFVLTPPYYYRYSQDELYRFFTKAADCSPIPLILYNVPLRLPNNLEPDLVESLSRHSNIIGIKETSLDAERLFKLLCIFKGREDFVVYSGSERFAAYTALFGGSFVYALAALGPKLFKEMLRLGKEKDTGGIQMLQDKINKLSGIFNAVKGGSQESFSNFSIGIKAGLKLKGICEIHGSQLGYELCDRDWERIKEAVLEAGISNAGK
ncbi:MAG: dihydrodipicolinate synthase family protein [Firmicutes bacterium]|nr:dihydrodipicolinate synthase family protein [Bacillota bacterium]